MMNERRAGAYGAWRAALSNFRCKWMLVIALTACAQLGAHAALVMQQGWHIIATGDGYCHDASLCATVRATAQERCDDYKAAFQLPSNWTVLATPIPGVDPSWEQQCLSRDQYGNATATWNAAIRRNGGLVCPQFSTKDSAGVCRCASGRGERPDGTACVVRDTADLAQGRPTCEKCSGNPISPLLGSKIEVVRTGVTLRGFELALTYDSSRGLRPIGPDDSAIFAETKPFGGLWRSNFHHKLDVSISRKRALLTTGGRYVLTFEGDGSGSFAALGNHSGTLETVAGGYRFTDRDEGATEVFDASGNIVSLTRIDGTVFSFVYDMGLLMSVQANDGRLVQFTYTNGLVSRITTPGRQFVDATYDSRGQLATLIWPDGKSRSFVYENVTFPWALTGIVDEKGQRYATFTYDEAGRAVSTEHAGGVDRYAVTYATPPTWEVMQTYDATTDTINRVDSRAVPQGTTVSTPNGGLETLEARQVQGLPVPTLLSRPAGSGSGAGVETVAYDAVGNVAAIDDATGARTCFGYDDRRRQTVRVEGLTANADCASVTTAGAFLPTNARKVTTAWHPDWRLVRQFTEPGLQTTLVYNGQPDPSNGNAIASCSSAPAMPGGLPVPLLCKRLEQALLPSGSPDSSIPARTTSFSYDAAGRLLSRQDPNGRVSQFSYYSGGSFDADTQYGKVQLLLHGDGADGATTFVDNSPTPKALTPSAAGPAIRTLQSKFGGASLGFTGNASLIAAPNAGWTFGASDDYTVEFWFYRTSGAGSTAGMVATNGGNRWAFFWRGATNRAAVYCANCGSFMESATILQLNRWYHYALTKQGTTFRLFVDGVLETTANTTQGTDASNVSLSVGGGFGGEYFAGFIDDVRVTKGVARYTASFTPPSRAYPQPPGSWQAVGTMAGDLQAVTNAAGHVTQYTGYDPAGQLRRSVDSKGVTSEITYTPRGLIETMTVTPPGQPARTTAYVYDDAGLATSASLPDGTTLSYEYDAAHRLTGITDGRGNSITYTLDANGNRIGEDVKDATGALLRSVVRSFDALNRLQQVGLRE